MPEIAPFRALCFNADRISFISRVVAPPYDVIGPELERVLQSRDPHNIVRLTFGKTPPAGRPDSDYEEAARLFGDWREEKILTQDERPSVYVVEQTFRVGDKEKTRLGFLACLRLEEFGNGVYPHERTMEGPRADMLKLLRACHANMSPVLTFYADPQGAADRLVSSLRGDPFLYSFTDDAGVRYQVWRVSDRPALGELARLMRERAVVIADGHHRYESALKYRALHRVSGGRPGTAPQDYVLAFMTSVENPGLVCLPTHRGVKADRQLRTSALRTVLKPFFSVKQAPAPDPTTLEAAYAAGSSAQQSIGCCLPKNRLYVLEPDFALGLRKRFPEDADYWWRLPVSLLHYVLLPDLLGILPGSPEESTHVEYTHLAMDVCRGVARGAYSVGFLLPAIDPHEVLAVAMRGKRLPPKSTFFYPKVLSGLAVHIF